MLQKLCASLLFTLLIASCSSSSSDETGQSDEGSKKNKVTKFMDSGFDKKGKKYDTSIRSKFDQKTYDADSKFKSREFKTDAYAGKHDFKGSDKYKTSEFSQAGKSSRESGAAFNGATKSAPESGESFDTSASRYASQQSRERGKVYGDANEQFETGSVRDVARSQKKNQRPEIIQKSGERGKTAYTEDDVRRMVNRN